MLAVTCPVLLEDRNHKCIAEIDGVFVRVDGIQYLMPGGEEPERRA